jgi:UPF0271 protein
MVIDLNADLGESPEALANGSDLALMHHITSANVACGGHAGDENTMRQTLRAARQLGVAVGAHPSFPDRENFGRVALRLSADAIQASVRDQVAALLVIATSLGIHLAHVKPHGALYHAANQDHETARAIGLAVQALDLQAIMVGQAGSSCLGVWRALGLRCAAEAFADRAYEPDGSLRRRTLDGALLTAPGEAARQALDIVVHNRVVSGDGSNLPLAADTLCIHSDTPGAVAIAREISDRLRQAGVEVRALGNSDE